MPFITDAYFETCSHNDKQQLLYVNFKILYPALVVHRQLINLWNP